MPLALLLFLICAMTASIVLAAGTVTVGRASNLAEADQAYYSVTSAVNLFRDELAGSDGRGHAVTVAVQKSSSGSTASYQTLVSTDGVRAGSSFSLLERAAMFLLFGNTGKNAQNSDAANEAARSYFTTNSGSWSTWPSAGAVAAGDLGTFSLSHSGSLGAAQTQALALEVKASLVEDGSLVFTFLKPGNDANGDGTPDDYLAIFNLTCEADIENGAFDTADSSDGVEIQYATVTWTPSIVEKG